MFTRMGCIHVQTKPKYNASGPGSDQCEGIKKETKVGQRCVFHFGGYIHEKASFKLKS